MKHSKKSVAMALALTAVASTAHAVDGEINIEGTIMPTSCVIDVAGGGENGTHVMQPIAAKYLANPGDRGLDSPFEITVGSPAIQCPASSVQIRFLGGANVDSTSGRMTNSLPSTDPDAATGVEVEMLNSTDQPIHLATNANSDLVPVISGVATLSYKTRYYAAAAATPGSFQSSVQYIVDHP